VTQKVEQKKNAVEMVGLEVHTAGWVNFVCI